MKFVRLDGTYLVENDTVTKVNDYVTPGMQSYRIAERKDKRNVQIYCKEWVEENIRQNINGQTAWEDQITIDELIKKGALRPS